MVSEGQFVGLDWNRIARLHSQVLVSTKLKYNCRKPLMKCMSAEMETVTNLEGLLYTQRSL